MTIFHSYVQLPEGINPKKISLNHHFPIVFLWFWGTIPLNPVPPREILRSTRGEGLAAEESFDLIQKKKIPISWFNGGLMVDL